MKALYLPRITLLLSMTLAAAGCATGPNVRVDSDPSVNLGTYKTFGFFDQVATDKAQYSTLLTTRLKSAVRTELEKNGYTYSENDPDLRANFFVKVTDKQDIRSTPQPMGPGFYGYRRYGAWGGYPDVETVNYKEGTLSIDLVDAKKNQLVWEGVATSRLSKDAIANPGPGIDAAVARIFANFPNPPDKK